MFPLGPRREESRARRIRKNVKAVVPARRRFPFACGGGNPRQICLRLPPIAVVNPDPMMAEVDTRMGGIVAATARIMSGNPAVPGPAVMAGDPDPVVPFVPVAGAMIIRPVTDADRE